MRRLPLLAPVGPAPDSRDTVDACTRSPATCGATSCAAGRVLRRCATSSPLLLVLEDCHWIDPLSKALLEAVGRNVDTMGVLVVVLSRSAERELFAEPGELAHVPELRLEPLRSRDAEDLARAKLRAAGRELDELPPAVRDAVRRAEGNPFFLEELIALLLERGIDLEDPSAFATAAVPDTLYGVVMARIDQLAEQDKSVLKVASVIGRAFRAQWVWSSAPGARRRAGRPQQPRRADPRRADRAFGGGRRPRAPLPTRDDARRRI